MNTKDIIALIKCIIVAITDPFLTILSSFIKILPFKKLSGTHVFNIIFDILSILVGFWAYRCIKNLTVSENMKLTVLLFIFVTILIAFLTCLKHVLPLDRYTRT